MGRFTFVGLLFLMAAACLVLALLSASFGWFIGGIVFLGVAFYAYRQLDEELENGPEVASNKFIIIAMLVTLVSIFGLFLLGRA